jgi:uncharacterized protein (TIGR00369 family)
VPDAKIGQTACYRQPYILLSRIPISGKWSSLAFDGSKTLAAILASMSDIPESQAEGPEATRVRESFGRQGLMRHLGARVVSVGPGRVEIRVPFRPELTQQHNYFHAGVSGAIADSACGYAAYTLMPADYSVLTVEYKINLIAPALGEELIARGRVLRSGKTLKVCLADVFVERNGKETQCATMLATIMGLAPKAGPDTRLP